MAMSKEFKAKATRDVCNTIPFLNLGRRRGRSHIAPETGINATIFPDTRFLRDCQGRSAWSSLPAELLQNIIQRVEAAESAWPGRRDVVACASVCKSWREATKDLVVSPEQCGILTFPISLKQPGPRDSPIQCFIRRDRPSSTYRLYLGLTPALSDDMSKLLLAAKKIRRAAYTEFRIFLSGETSCQTSSNSIGKLRSNFLGTTFAVQDTLLLPSPGDVLCSSKSIDNTRPHRVASISYELNMFRTRGPRRMNCIMDSIPLSSVLYGGIATIPSTLLSYNDGKPSSWVLNREPLVLKNKTPRWHEQLQCWCLNFKGRVTVASVKNFQLVASAKSAHIMPVEEQEKVILQFGRIGKDIFTMDYRYPLSAFQAFAICLSSFDTKPACE